ncbi:hypothetical protein [Haladaptatus sp. DJG-WS-42]|uniref:hypothetical protein n=1 Tax=Haladaptatus sp. DJG-WS-42 TaxID=3120516 RepID=UPI0030CC0B6A
MSHAAFSLSRRRLLALVSGTVFFAGCTSGGTDADTAPSTATSATSAEPTTTDTSESEMTTQTDLDLREANVMAVAFEKTGDTTYRFDVTLLHDDDGEDGYANWWQVETLAGEQLGRRELLHAHGTQEFTRSGTIEIPEGVARVVVRGHDQTHGYGGQAMSITLETGETEAVRQGSEKQSFDEY